MGLGEGRGRRFRRALVPLVAVTVLLSWFVVGSRPTPAARAQTSTPPNIVLILTDDQRFDSLHVMPEVQRLANRGMVLRRAIVSNALCCPSRATILTGRYSHTTGVYKNGSPHGGWGSFQPWEGDTIATALDAAGYRTALIGKYLNGYKRDVYVPQGWDRWSVFAGANGLYYDYRLYDDRSGIVNHGTSPIDYSTDVLGRLSTAFVQNTSVAQPFFLLVAPFAPHGPSTPAPRHEGTLDSAPVKLSPAVNERDVSDKPRYIRERKRVPTWLVRRRSRRQWESLLAVDELVGRLVTRLKRSGRLDDTLIIFTSDNGMANHEHRWNAKEVPYEQSIRVPMVVSFPGVIPRGTRSNALVSNVDLAPTIADFAGVPFSADGLSLRPLLTDHTSSVRDAVVLEHLDSFLTTVPTYCGVRTSGFMFTSYETGMKELYDLAADPHQLQNVARSRPNKTAELLSLTQTLCDPVPPGFSW